MPLTILRTAAGSAPSVTQYKVFQELGLRVIASDSDALSVGFVFADAAYQVPLVASPQYLGTLIEICRREHVDWILPALDEELLTLAGHRARTGGMRHATPEPLRSKASRYASTNAPRMCSSVSMEYPRLRPGSLARCLSPTFPSS